MGKRQTSSAKNSSRDAPVSKKADLAKKKAAAGRGASQPKLAKPAPRRASEAKATAQAKKRAVAKPAKGTAVAKGEAVPEKAAKAKSKVSAKAPALKATAPRSPAIKHAAKESAKPAKTKSAVKAPVKETIAKAKAVKPAPKSAAVKTPPANNTGSLRNSIAATPSVRMPPPARPQATGNLRLVPAAKQMPAVRSAKTEFDGFKVNDHVVYPAHGVGKIIAVEEQEIAGTRLELFVIVFEHEKMTLRVPLGKAKTVGMRMLASKEMVRTALKTLRGRARVKRTMWSRRAQEYEAKINSGDLLSIAEVVRDLHRAEGQPEQSYSERQIYESALERLAREVGAVEELNGAEALQRVEVALLKAA